MSLGSVVIDLLARTGSFETDTKRAAKIAQQRAKEIDEAFTKAGKAIGVALAAGATAAAYAFKTTVDRMDELSKAAQRASMPTEDFSRLAYAADLADVSMQDLQGSMGKLAKAQGDAARGLQEQVRAFDALGIAYKNTDGSLRNTKDVFFDFADKFAQFQGKPEIVALGMQLFGRSFQNLIPLLKDGAQGLKDAGAEADAFGVTVSTQAGQQAEAFNDNLTRLKAAAEGLKIELFSGLIPQLDNLVSRYVALTRLGKGPVDVIEGMFGEGSEKKIEGFERRIADLTRIREQMAKQGEPSWWQRQLNPALRSKDSIDQELIALAGKLEQARQVQRLLSPPDLSRLNVTPPGKLPSLAAPASAAGRARRSDMTPVDMTDEQRTLIAAIGLYTDVERRSKDYGLTLEWLDKLYFDGAIGAQQYDTAVLQLSKSHESLGADGDKALQGLADRWKDLIDPTREYQRQLDEIRKLVDAGKLTSAQGIAAEFEVESKRNDDMLGGLPDTIKKSDDAARQLGLTFSSAFEDAILGGKGLRDVLGGIGQDILKLMVRKSITEPAANWLSSVLNFGSFFGGGKAAGGDVSAGMTYLVGERGPELFTPKSAGSITSNDKLGGKQVIVQQSLTFASNVDRAQMAAYAERIKQSTIASIRQANLSGNYALTGG